MYFNSSITKSGFYTFLQTINVVLSYNGMDYWPLMLQVWGVEMYTDKPILNYTKMKTLIYDQMPNE